MRKVIVAAVVLICGGWAYGAEALKAYDGVVLKATEGKGRVTVVYLAPKGSGKVLIKFENTGSDWDGQIIPHHIANAGPDRRDIKLDGKDNWNTISVRGQGWGWGSDTWVYVKGGDNDGIAVYEDKAASEKLNLENFIREYQKQNSKKKK